MASSNLLDRLINRLRQPEAKRVDGDGREENEGSLELRYVYRVVVDGDRDDRLLVRDEPVTIEAEVPFRGRTVFVEHIEELHETDASGRDLGERLEAEPDTQIARTLICREPVPLD